MSLSKDQTIASIGLTALFALSFLGTGASTGFNLLFKLLFMAPLLGYSITVVSKKVDELSTSPHSRPSSPLSYCDDVPVQSNIFMAPSPPQYYPYPQPQKPAARYVSSHIETPRTRSNSAPLLPNARLVQTVHERPSTPPTVIRVTEQPPKPDARLLQTVSMRPSTPPIVASHQPKPAAKLVSTEHQPAPTSPKPAAKLVSTEHQPAPTSPKPAAKLISTTHSPVYTPGLSGQQPPPTSEKPAPKLLSSTQRPPQ